MPEWWGFRNDYNKLNDDWKSLSKDEKIQKATFLENKIRIELLGQKLNMKQLNATCLTDLNSAQYLQT